VGSRIAGRETYADRVTFTNVRFGLVLTPMVSDSVMYRNDKQRPDSAAARGEPVG
jgi:hypothetical protein